MQHGFDFTGLRDELGGRYEQFVQQWTELQALLSGRGRAALDAGRILVSFQSSYGAEWLAKVLSMTKAPGIARAKMLMTAYEYLREIELTDEQLAVLDSIIYTRMQQARRMQALQMLVNGRSAQEIDDFIDATRPPPGPDSTVPRRTEEQVRLDYVEQLRAEGWHIESAEGKTADGGRVDILACKEGTRPIIVECKAYLDRAHTVEALGQLTIYSQTYRDREWVIAYDGREDEIDPIIKACAAICRFAKVTRSVAAEA